MPAKNGINMLDVKVRNRRAILELIYRSKKIPRKDIATQLGLTPAAITLITNDLIQEGILIETEKKESNSRGRREVLLQINAKKFYVIGVSITRNHYELIAMDLNKEILYQNKFRTVDFHHDAKQILAAIMETIQSDILSSSVINKKKLLGIGVSTLGIVNSETGVSLNSYGVFHESIAIADIFEKRFAVPTLLTNNICASAHAEAFLANSALETGRLLFINYGPDIGSALLSNTDYFNIYDYRAVQLAHVTVEPHGRPCICGNSGCLETVVSYDASPRIWKNSYVTRPTRRSIMPYMIPLIPSISLPSFRNMRMEMSPYRRKSTVSSSTWQPLSRMRLHFSIRIPSSSMASPSIPESYAIALWRN